MVGVFSFWLLKHFPLQLFKPAGDVLPLTRYGPLPISCNKAGQLRLIGIIPITFSQSAMTIDPGSVPKAAIPTLDDDYENDTEAVDRLVRF